ncbi:response regulator [Micromonospora cathayae]|uniref:Response regulator n=1 Tax=Micromonospora cathayae TaxID=3028804 RepID=A0ABY7ZII5_9ACTN|nr:response regulator [Micromonospora sp. HUAS 3]WDZ82765.1 response regulator [Micromonospora sp. HUAS 3]
MPEAAWLKLIGVLPGLLWVVFATVVFFTLRSGLVGQLDRLTALRTPFGEADFAAGLALLEEAEQRAGTSAPLSPQQRRAVVNRLDHAAACLKDGRLLWVDDNPAFNQPIVRLLERSGMTVDLARSTEEALTRIDRHGYDLLITDVRRGDDDQAGIRLVTEVARRRPALPIVIFTAGFDPRRGVDPAVFAYTTDVDEVVHYVIDIMERLRFGSRFSRAS